MKLKIYAVYDPLLLISENRKAVSKRIKKYVIEREFKITEIDIVSGKNGKPGVLGRSDIYFNTSHSGEILICAACCFPIGVDVERHRHVTEALRNIIVPQSAEKNDKTFFEVWTMREAWIKARGENISKNTLLNSPVKVTAGNELFYEAENVVGGNIFIHKEYSCCYCVMTKEIVKAEIVFINLSDLLK